MRNGIWFLVGVGAGALAVMIGQAVLVGGRPVPPEPAASGDRAASMLERSESIPSAADRARQLEELTAAVRGLERKLDAIAEHTPERVPVSGAPAGIDEGVLLRVVQRALDQRELDRWTALKDFELYTESQRLMTMEPMDRRGAQRALGALLARQLTPSLRARAVTQLGMLQRISGQLADSAATLQRALDGIGIDTQEGAEAAYQLIWTLSEQHNDAAALQLADQLGRRANAGPLIRMNARWAEAVAAASAGDTARARSGFQWLLMQCQGNSQYRSLTDDCQRRLDALH